MKTCESTTGRALPDEIQASINSAQSSFARITEARAEAERAKAQRQAAQTLAEVYERSPALAQIQMIREAKDLEGSRFEAEGRADDLATSLNASDQD